VDDSEPLGHDDLWRQILAGSHPAMRVGRRLYKQLPGEPRCKLCAAPLQGGASPLMRLMGKGPWPKNPKFCSSCFRELARHHGGAEIECSLMFADVRGSTAMAEGMRPSEVYDLMDRFFGAAARALPIWAASTVVLILIIGVAPGQAPPWPMISGRSWVCFRRRYSSSAHRGSLGDMRTIDGQTVRQRI